FVQACRSAKDDPPTMVRLCQQLLEQTDLETAVRAGDCFATLIEHFHAQHDWKKCY
ncbi:unnamed protein product, partial [Choristocarpus tenellus]